MLKYSLKDMLVSKGFSDGRKLEKSSIWSLLIYLWRNKHVLDKIKSEFSIETKFMRLLHFGHIKRKTRVTRKR